MSMPDSRSEPYQHKNESWIRFKYVISNQLRKMPLLWKPLRRIWRSTYNHAVDLFTTAAVLKAKMKGYYGKDFNVDRIVWVDSRNIQFATLKEFPVTTFKGRVIGGNWDLLEKKFDDLDIYQAVRSVCLEGQPWQSTIFYQSGLAAINGGRILWGCSDQQSFYKRCNDLERLFQSIQQDGYKTQDELVPYHNAKEPRSKKDDEVGVCIGRHGDLLFSDGAHRTSIAKALGLQSVPVKIVVRHNQWAEFRKRLLCYSKKHGVKRVQPAPHPDLYDIPCNQEFARLFEVMMRDLQTPNCTILDIGAQLGYFCHRFEEQGQKCYALEERQEELDFLKILHQAGKRQFKIISDPITTFEPAPGTIFDTILVLDHLFQAQSRPETCVDLLNCLSRLEFRRLYILDPGGSETSQHGRLAALINQLDIKTVKPLVHTADGGTLYLLTRANFE